MFDKISDWFYHRALRLSAKKVIELAKKTKQDPRRIVALNDAVAGIAAHEAVQAAARSAAWIPVGDVVAKGNPNAGN